MDTKLELNKSKDTQVPCALYISLVKDTKEYVSACMVCAQKIITAIIYSCLHITMNFIMGLPELSTKSSSHL